MSSLRRIFAEGRTLAHAAASTAELARGMEEWQARRAAEGAAQRRRKIARSWDSAMRSVLEDATT